MAMTTSSQICIRIVLAFLQFLSTVQTTSSAEKDRIKSVVKNLREIFNIEQSMLDEVKQRPAYLVTLFSTPEDEPEELEDFMSDEPSSSSAPTKRRSSSRGTSTAIGRNMVNFRNEFKQAVLKYGGLESLVGQNNPNKKSNVSKIFNQALVMIRQEGPSMFTMKDVAEALKTLGNKAMENTCYCKAVEFYSCAIAITLDNAVYYCNRGAALIKIQKYYEAVGDCYKAINLNSSYTKAYYRLGLAYSEQGKYFDAICEGFLRVLQIDPRNKASLANIELAEGRLWEQITWLDEELEIMRKNGSISRCRKVGFPREGTALVYQGKAEDGISDKFVLVDQEEGEADPSTIEETMSMAEFIDLFSRSNMAS